MQFPFIEARLPHTLLSIPDFVWLVKTGVVMHVRVLLDLIQH
jgi:hypothetical protein